MRFSKYHGIGNDFVMLADPDNRLSMSAEMVRGICDRRFGVGADGVIRVAPGTEGGHLFMDYVNSDGSVGEMCGNGIRCLAVFARDEGLTAASSLQVETRAGLKTVDLLGDDKVRVDMGPPIFEPDRIPVRWEGTEALHVKLDAPADTLHLEIPANEDGEFEIEYELEPEVFEAACLSMGNPHAVLFVDDPATAPVTSLGPRLEHHELFPNRANVEFIRVAAPDRVEMRVWERGSGETLACGTGACAAAVAARLLGGANERVVVALPGGELDIEWSGSLTEERPVLMTGPVVRAFTGELNLEEYGS